MLSSVQESLKSVKYMTWVILTVTIVVSVLVAIYVERNPASKEHITASMHIIVFYILIALLLFAILTHILVKVETSAIYSMKCIHGINYRTKLKSFQHGLFRFLHLLPLVGDLVNVVLFHTCTRK